MKEIWIKRCMVMIFVLVIMIVSDSLRVKASEVNQTIDWGGNIEENKVEVKEEKNSERVEQKEEIVIEGIKEEAESKNEEIQEVMESKSEEVKVKMEGKSEEKQVETENKSEKITESNLMITGYAVTDEEGKKLNSISNGMVANIVVSLKDSAIKTKYVKTDDIDISKLVDSFQGGRTEVVIMSDAEDALVYQVKLNGVQYSGIGKNLKLLSGIKGNSKTYTTVELIIQETVEYEKTKLEEIKVPSEAPAPMVILSRNDISKPMMAGEEREITLFVKNLSKTKLTSVLMNVSTSDAIMISGGTTSFSMGNIDEEKTGSIKVKIKAANTIATPNQILNVEVKYNYHNNISVVQGETIGKVEIPVVVQNSVSQPIVLVTCAPVLKPISAEEQMDITINLKNAGSTKMISPVAYMKASDSLIIMNEVSTIILPDMNPGETKEIVIKVKATKEITSPNQFIAAEVKYGYHNGGELVQAESVGQVYIAANTTDRKLDASVPNIIISSFKYGGEAVAVGGEFELSFSFENTGKLGIENIVVTVDGGESFTMNNSTNTFFYSSLKAGGKQKQNIPMQVVSSARSGAQSIGVSFKYEYMDGEKRASNTADIKISVPVYQPDRFEVNAPLSQGNAVVGEEMVISLSYVNKGKGEVSNLEASIISDDVEAVTKTQYIGNVAAGISGNIGLLITPIKEGKNEVTLKITYEDADQNVKIKEFPLEFTAAQAEIYTGYMEETYKEEMPKKKSSVLTIIIPSIAVITFAFSFIKMKKRKNDNIHSEEMWGEWGEETEDMEIEELQEE